MYLVVRSLLTQKTTFCRLSDVVSLTGLSKHSVSRQISSLVKERHFTLVHDKHDMRSILIYKTNDKKIMRDKIRSVSHVKDMWYMGMTKFNVKQCIEMKNSDLRAHIYTSLVRKNFANNPVTRHALKDLSGVDVKTQKKYEKLRETTKERTFITLTSEQAELLTERQKNHPKVKEINEGQIDIQIGNRYGYENDNIVKPVFGRKAKKVRKTIRSIFREILGKDAYFNKGTGATVPKFISRKTKSVVVPTIISFDKDGNDTFVIFQAGEAFNLQMI